MHENDFILVPNQTLYKIALEPAHNNVYSLVLLGQAEKYSGFNDWVTNTYQALNPRERKRNKLITSGFFHALKPDRSWHHFTDFVDYLATRNPNDLRDRMINAYYNKSLLYNNTISERFVNQSSEIHLDEIIKDVDSYLQFLTECYNGNISELELEAQAYSFMIDPPAMQDLIVSHLRKMWERYLQEEWEKVKSMLNDSVKAFHQYDLNSMDKFEAVKFLCCNDFNDADMKLLLDQSRQIIFVPSAHIGPYLGKFMYDDTLWIIFGAKLPEGTELYAPDLSRTEIAMSLGALTDDIRLRILKLVSEKGELSSQDIMTALDLSQSAASRHLKQLSAIGYILERRCKCAKCYQINSDKIRNTLAAVKKFLIKE